MAKTSMIEKNEQRKKTVARFAEKRKQLKEVIKSIHSTPEERDEAYRKLRALPRDANPNRIVNRCSQTGRPRAYIRKFGLSRIALREMALKGELPGVRKASW